MLRLATPTFFIDSVANIHPEDLVQNNIAGATFDLDSTLVDHVGKETPQEHLDMLYRLASHGIWLGVISNATEKDRTERARYIVDEISKEIGANVFLFTSAMEGFRSKPSKTMFHAAAEMAELHPANMAHVDDQILKGVVGANHSRYGASILVAKYGEHDDPKVAMFQRPLEAGIRPVVGVPRSYARFPNQLTRPLVAPKRLKRAPIWAQDWDA
jgi:predicted HAD superfamily phosphohydrolase YqeG